MKSIMNAQKRWNFGQSITSRIQKETALGKWREFRELAISDILPENQLSADYRYIEISSWESGLSKPVISCQYPKLDKMSDIITSDALSLHAIALEVIINRKPS